MPRKYRKKRYQKKGRKYRTGYLAKRGRGLSKSFPLSKKFKFNTRYVDPYVVLDPGIGGVMISQVYSLTSLYDPDVTGTGHQPLGFDQLMAMYNHYTVIGARIKITASNSDTSTPQNVLLTLSDTPTVNNSYTNTLENGMTRSAVLGPLGSGNSIKTLTLNCNPSIFLGRKVMQSDECKGSASASPTENVYAHCSVVPHTVGIDTSPVNISVLIEFISILTEPNQLSGS